MSGTGIHRINLGCRDIESLMAATADASDFYCYKAERRSQVQEQQCREILPLYGQDLKSTVFL